MAGRVSALVPVIAMKWEYATLSWRSEMRKILRSDPEWDQLPEKTRREAHERLPFTYMVYYTYNLWFPGAPEPDKRHGWHSDMPKDQPRAVLLDLLNELGQDGWELVTSSVRSSAMGSWLGREPASYPTEVSYTFKRPVVEAAE
jgi:hypothetical protein